MMLAKIGIGYGVFDFSSFILWFWKPLIGSQSVFLVDYAVDVSCSCDWMIRRFLCGLGVFRNLRLCTSLSLLEMLI